MSLNLLDAFEASPETKQKAFKDISSNKFFCLGLFLNGGIPPAIFMALLISIFGENSVLNIKIVTIISVTCIVTFFWFKSFLSVLNKNENSYIYFSWYLFLSFLFYIYPTITCLLMFIFNGFEFVILLIGQLFLWPFYSSLLYIKTFVKQINSYES